MFLEPFVNKTLTNWHAIAGKWSCPIINIIKEEETGYFFTVHYFRPKTRHAPIPPEKKYVRRRRRYLPVPWAPLRGALYSRLIPMVQKLWLLGLVLSWVSMGWLGMAVSWVSYVMFFVYLYILFLFLLLYFYCTRFAQPAGPKFRSHDTMITCWAP